MSILSDLKAEWLNKAAPRAGIQPALKHQLTAYDKSTAYRIDAEFFRAKIFSNVIRCCPKSERNPAMGASHSQFDGAVADLKNICPFSWIRTALYGVFGETPPFRRQHPGQAQIASHGKIDPKVNPGIQ